MLVPDPKIWESTKTSLPMDNLQYFTLIQEKFYKKKVEVLANGEEIRNSFTPYKYEVVRTVVPADTSKNKQVQIYVTFEVSENLSERKTQGSVNSLTVNGGHHIQIFESCYREALTKYYNFSHNYIFNGLKCLVIVLCNETLWSGKLLARIRR